MRNKVVATGILCLSTGAALLCGQYKDPNVQRIYEDYLKQMEAARNSGFVYQSEAQKQADLRNLDAQIERLRRDAHYTEHHKAAYDIAVGRRQAVFNTPVSPNAAPSGLGRDAVSTTPVGGFGDDYGRLPNDRQRALDEWSKGTQKLMEDMRTTLEAANQQVAEQTALDDAHYEAMRRDGLDALNLAAQDTVSKFNQLDASEGNNRALSAEALELSRILGELDMACDGLGQALGDLPTKEELLISNHDAQLEAILGHPLGIDPLSAKGLLPVMTPENKSKLYELVDGEFYKLNPEMQGKKIDPSTQPEYRDEWLKIRDGMLENDNYFDQNQTTQYEHASTTPAINSSSPSTPTDNAKNLNSQDATVMAKAYPGDGKSTNPQGIRTEDYSASVGPYSVQQEIRYDDQGQPSGFTSETSVGAGADFGTGKAKAEAFVRAKADFHNYAPEDDELGLFNHSSRKQVDITIQSGARVTIKGPLDETTSVEFKQVDQSTTHKKGIYTGSLGVPSKKKQLLQAELEMSGNPEEKALIQKELDKLK